MEAGTREGKEQLNFAPGNLKIVNTFYKERKERLDVGHGCLQTKNTKHK